MNATENTSKIDPIYTAHATLTGGRAGHGETDDGLLSVDLQLPKEMGGHGGGTNPEQLFAVGYGACFQGALGLAGNELGVTTTDSVVKTSVAIGKEGESYALCVDITVHIDGYPLQEVERVAQRAHQLCPYSKATRGNIPVTVTAVQ